MDPWLGEIRSFAFNRVPHNWKPCDGSLLPINQNQALFSLIGTQFGGDGRTNFALPDLRGRAIVDATARTAPVGVNYAIGQIAGAEAISLTVEQMPSHNHWVRASPVGDNQALADKSYFAKVSQQQKFATVNIYGPPSDELVALKPDTVSSAPVSGPPHNNMQPFAVVSYCIAVSGAYPGHE